MVKACENNQACTEPSLTVVVYNYKWIHHRAVDDRTLNWSSWFLVSKFWFFIRMHNTINSNPTPNKPIDNPPCVQNKRCPWLTLFLSLPLHATINPFIISRLILFDSLNCLGTLTKGLLILLMTIFNGFSIKKNSA